MPMIKEYRKQWVEAGYNRNIGSAEVVQPPEPGFMRLYYLTSPEFAIGNIGLSRIKAARFSQLNDPFELLAASYFNAASRKRARKFKDEYGEKYGLICFSKNWINPVLWSHYGSKHQGVCLGVDVRRDLVREVRYEKARLRDTLRYSQQEDYRIAFEEMLICTKFDHWVYEEEARVILPIQDLKREGGLHFFPMGETMRLREVILGALCEIDLESVRGLLASRYNGAVRAFGSRLAIKTFSIVPKESTVDW